MTSLADKIRKQLKAGKKPKEIAAMFGTSETYVRASGSGQPWRD
jgi:hypothetical protein